MNEQNTHLTSETLQAYLEGELSRERAERVESHLTGCARCASERDAWELLFSELNEMPALEPSPGFADRVLEEAPAHPSLVRRLTDRVRSVLRNPAGEATEHLGPDRIQDLLDGAMGSRDWRSAHAHLDACTACRSEVEEWKGLFATLSSVPTLDPSPGFQDRVMASLQRARASGKLTVPSVTTGWLAAAMQPVAVAARRVTPTTGRGWAWLGGVVSLPAVGLLAILGAVFAHPLLTFEGLAAFAQWRLADGLQGVFASLTGWIMESPLLLTGWELATEVAASPGAAVAGAAGLWILVLVSAWIFYRNVIAPSFVAGHHA